MNFVRLTLWSVTVCDNQPKIQRINVNFFTFFKQEELYTLDGGTWPSRDCQHEHGPHSASCYNKQQPRITRRNHLLAVFLFTSEGGNAPCIHA